MNDKRSEKRENVGTLCSIVLPVYASDRGLNKSSMNGPVVTVKHGQLRGANIRSVIGKPYISFKGIPYAAPPVGDLRFRDPQPLSPWSGVRNALVEGPKCAQPEPLFRKIEGQDDCLYLNVATKSLSDTKPVMVWIHGGSFSYGSGSSDFYGPDYLIEGGIVFVSFNYRLGVLGFLQLEHKAAGGNMGLKDMVEVLKWVKENIAQFGGDPNNVTIFGESAGAAAVHYILLSPLAKGLYHKAIVQSGVVLNPWVYVSSTVNIAHRLVASLGKSITDPYEIVEFLRTIPAHNLIRAEDNLFTIEEKVTILSPFGPTVDNQSAVSFLPQHPVEIAKEGVDVPLIIGYNSHEGLAYVNEFRNGIYSKLDECFEIPYNLATRASGKNHEFKNEIRKFYFGNKKIGMKTVTDFVQCSGDISFVMGIHEVVEIQRTKESPTYFYRFSYDNPNSLLKKLTNVNLKGTIHGDDIQYLFHQRRLREFFSTPLSVTEKIVSNRFVKMWTDFAKTGNPTPKIDELITEKWEPITITTKHYMEINEKLFAGRDPNKMMWQNFQRISAMFYNK